MNERKRLLPLAFLLFSLFCLLIVRFFQIQIIDGKKWTEVAFAQHQFVHTEPFRRGTFYSNTTIKPGHPEEALPLVIDVAQFHLYIDPKAIPDAVKPKMVDFLASLLHLNGLEKKKAHEQFYKLSRSRKIKMWLGREEKERVLAWWTRFAREEKIVRNALFFTTDYKRSYPYGTLLGSVLHTVQNEKEPITQQALPTGGLELSLNPYLSGKLGKRLITRSPRHALDSGELLEAPKDGADVYLTINHVIQAIAERELKKGVEAVHAKGGWAVIMDPMNGEILALAQTPSFDPANYSQFFNQEGAVELAKVRAVTDAYELGSIMKGITVAVALEANEELKKRGKAPLFSPEEKVATSNGHFPGRSTPIKEAKTTHRFLNMNLAIQKSSNIYMGRIVQRIIEELGEQWYRNALTERFGFGSKTGIELPGETAGVVPTPGKLHPNGRLEWSVPTPYSMAIGYNLMASSLQLLRAYATIANGGYRVEPHLVKQIARGEEILLKKNQERRPCLSPAIAKRVTEALRYSTQEGGTSRRAAIPGYTSAGKSGTAEKIIDGLYSKGHHVSSFVGFAPVTSPRLVMIVTLDDPEKVDGHQFGGYAAAPIFRETALQTLRYLGVAPDDPAQTEWKKEVQAIRELYQEWNR